MQLFSKRWRMFSRVVSCFECSDSLIAQGVKTALLADFLGRQSWAENAIQSSPFLIGEQGVNQGAEAGLMAVKRHLQDADKNLKISL